MASSLADSTFDLYFTHSFSLMAGGLLVLFYFSSLKLCFGTYSLTTAMANYKKNKQIREHYLSLFKTRDSLMYHISWAKSRGEPEEAKRLMTNIEKIDKEIDDIETSNEQLFGRKKEKIMRNNEKIA